MAATHTPNLNLNKPDRQDYVSVVNDINDNMDKIDEEAGMVDDGIAIVIDGNTAPRAISSGQYLLIKNHSTLATGGYHATANIANGESVTSSNVAVDSDGIANALNGNFGGYKIVSKTESLTFNTVGKCTFDGRKNIIYANTYNLNEAITVGCSSANTYLVLYNIASDGWTRITDSANFTRTVTYIELVAV